MVQDGGLLAYNRAVDGFLQVFCLAIPWVEDWTCGAFRLDPKQWSLRVEATPGIVTAGIVTAGIVTPGIVTAGMETKRRIAKAGGAFLYGCAALVGLAAVFGFFANLTEGRSKPHRNKKGLSNKPLVR
jgi:hypothetical protein